MKKGIKMLNRCIIKISIMVICLAIALGLKYQYSKSNSDSLGWILAPTAYLVEVTGDMRFEKETGTGYVDHASGIIIAPSCSGVNFMIIVFCLSAYKGIKKTGKTDQQFVWIIVSLTGSYIYTLIVNTCRINLSIYSIRTDFLQAWFSGETVHLIEGVLVYFIFLIIFNSILNRIIYPGYIKKAEKPNTFIRRLFLPFSLYLFFTLLIPVFNHGGIFINNGFFRYAFIVLTSCFMVLTISFLFRMSCHYVATRVK
jgi:exosortase K